MARKSSEEYERSRKRIIRKPVRFTSKEWEAVEQNLINSPYTNLNDYIVKACLNVEIKIIEHDDLFSLANEINRIGVNINQVVKHINETNSIYSNDIKFLQDKINQMQKLILNEFNNRLKTD